MKLRQAAREIAWLCERRPGQVPSRRAASIRADQDPFSANEHNLRPASHRRGRDRSGGHPFEPTLSIDCSNESENRRASRLGRQWLNDLLRRKVQEQRERAERERIRAETARLAAIEERCLKRVLGGWVEQLQKSRSAYPRPRPSGAGRKPVLSSAGEVADKGRKWGG
jgi:hypothetical protein